MATTYTTYAKLSKPAYNDSGWDVTLNTNATTLDGMGAIGPLCVTLAEVPSASLNVAVAAGTFVDSSGAFVTYAGTASQAITTGTTKYLYLNDAGSLTVASAWPAATVAQVRLAVVVAGASTITSITDARTPWMASMTGSYLPLSGGTMGEAANVALGTTTGSKIGTSTAQKLGVWNATPIVQPVNTVALDDAIVNIGLRASGGIANLTGVLTHPGTFASIYVYDGSTAQSISTGTTPTLLTCFNTAAGFNGPANDATAAKAANKITITRSGTYLVTYSFSYLSGTNDITWEMYVFNDGAAVTSTGSMSKTATSSDTQCISGVGIMAIAANKDIDLRGYHDNGGSVNITPSHVSFTATRIGN